jgi:hypothetical protein
MRKARIVVAVVSLSGCSSNGGAEMAWEPTVGDGSTGSTGTSDRATEDSTHAEGPDATTSEGPDDPDAGSTSGAATTGPTGEPESCAVVDVEGTCMQAAACPAGSTAFGAVCDDVPSIQCCVPEEPACSVDGAPGLCLDVDACPGSFVTTPGLCPGDANIQCCTDPTTACDPGQMPLPNDGLTEESWDPQCPDGMVRSDGFCIDRYEASLIELDAAGNVVSSWSPYFNPGTTRVRAVSIAGAIPQGYISQPQAAAACSEAGKRLCTDTEWLRACRGETTTTYPYGDVHEPGRCNEARDAHPVVEYFGTSADWIWSELDHPCIAQLPDGLDITGLNDRCASEDGAFDMMGNLHEWTADPAGTFRGGFYVDTTINGPGCNYATTAHDVSHWDYSTGFRCCAD